MSTLQSVKCTQPLSRSEQQELHARHLDGDAEATDTLVQSCVPLVMSVAGRRVKESDFPHIDMADVVSVGLVALVGCLKTWDPDRGTLAGWAWRPVHWQINSYLRRERRARNAASCAGAAGCRHTEPPETDVVVNAVDRRITLSDVLLVAGRVDRRGPEIVRSRLEGHTFRQIAGRMGITHQRVRQISEGVRLAAREQISCTY